jgi:hypothetical protein
MPRPYGDKLLRSLQTAEEETLGIELGRVCVAANIPAAYVAIALEASRMTVYSWFRGQDIRRNRRKIVRTLVELMKQDLETGILPAKDYNAARQYIESLAGVKI